MMIKLNNKGMTVIEILVCFMLVSFISVALFSTVSAYNNKRNVESIKSELFTYKNAMIKRIEDDLISRTLINADVDKDIKDAATTQYNLRLYFRDGSVKDLEIFSQRAGEYSSDGAAGSDDSTCTGKSDLFYIAYGNQGRKRKYFLPQVGDFKTECTSGEVIQDLRFNTINVSKEGNVLFIYIGFYHPELGNDYSINIVAPINYIATGTKQS